jgi:glutathione peroxidase
MKRSTFALIASVFALSAAAAIVVSAKPSDRTGNVIKDPTATPAKAREGQPVSPLDFKLKSIDGKDFDLSQFKGKAVLLVNVASKCGLTPQYEALESLYEKYKDKGFVIVGFPANNFGGQEPGTEAEIKKFCSSKYNVQFPMTSKISVKGDDQHPLYKFLTSKDTNGDFAGDIEWNFAKFLVDRNGNVMARFASKTKPSDPQVVAAIEKAIASPAGEKTASAK